MKNELMISNSREIARAAMQFSFHAKSIAKHVERDQVEIAIENYRRALIPAKEVHADLRRDDQRELANLIGKIGNRIRPDFNDKQAKKWASEIVDALSNLPIRVALQGTRDAMHYPFRYPGEVHAVLLDYCGPHLLTYQRAMANLERLLKEIDNPTPEKSGDLNRVAKPMPIEELTATTRQSFLNVGILIEGKNGELRYTTDEEWEARQQAIKDERNIARARGKE